MCWCLPGTFKTLLSRRWWLPRKNCYGRWNLGPLPPAGKPEKSSEEWRHTSSTKPKKFRTQLSAGNVMLTLFWDKRGIILQHYMPKRNPVISTTYADLLKNHLRPAIKSKRRGNLSTGCFASTWKSSVPYCPFNCCNNPRLSFECVPHPPYSPDLDSSDFHVFGPLKEAMGCKCFRSDEEVQHAVQERLHSQPKEFFF
jgi:histone-lysine N-methyltransferase SETMAR